MTTSASPTILLNSTNPASPANGINVKPQAAGGDPNPVSFYLPCPGGTTTFLRADGTFATPPGGGGTASFQGQQFRSYIWGYKVAYPTGLGTSGGPFSPSEQINTTSATLAGSQAAGTNNGAGCKISTASTSVMSAIFGDTIYRVGRNIKLLGRFWLSRITDVRVQLCMATTVDATDSPNLNYMGFHFSSIAGNTNWQCITSSGSTPTIVDSGVAADTHEHSFAIVMDDTGGSGVLFYIDGVLVATITTTKPTAGTNLCYVLGSEGISAGPSMFFQHIIIDSDM